MQFRGSLALLFAVALVAPAPAQQGSSRPGQVAAPPRDATPRPTRSTAVIRGRIVDADTGLPLRRATVQLTQRVRSMEPRAAFTDEQGRFEINELAAGEYMVFVRKPGYAAASYGQRRQGDSPRPLTLRDGEVFAKADVALTRGGVITGRVVDELGEPVLEASVRVTKQQWMAGRKRAMPVGGGQTNDLGVYRVFGLQPGEYLVSASSWAFRGGAPDNATTDYAPVFYPGTTDLALARPVAVAAGQETLVDLAIAPVPVARVTGIVLDGVGKPVSGGRVMAAARAADGAFAFDSQRSGTVKADGTFIVTGLTPGTWRLMAQQGRGGPDGGEREVAIQEVAVADQPVEGVTLVMTAGGTLRGKLVFEGAAPPRDVTAYRVLTRSADEVDGMDFGSGPGRVNADGTFEVTSLIGRRLAFAFPGGPQNAAAAAPQGWALKAVISGGRDVQDTGLEFLPGRVVNADIVMSRDFAELSGTVTTDRGEPVTDYSVLAFSEDREKWFLPSQRWVKSARSDQDGRFRVPVLAPGRYLVVAVEGLDSSTTGDPDQLERLRGLATDVTLDDREKKSITLTLVTP